MRDASLVSEAVIERAAALLREEGAREVYVFGSVAAGRQRAGSDLDIAVAGLPPERFFRAVGRLLTELPVSVDLIDLDRSSPVTDRLRDSGSLRRVA